MIKMLTPKGEWFFCCKYYTWDNERISLVVETEWETSVDSVDVQNGTG